jgi:hypothetical protein
MGQRDMNESPRLQELYARRVAAHGGADAGPHATPEAILAVVQREGPEAERLATLEHVMSCATCHRDYEWLSAVDVAGDEFEERTGEHPIQSRPWWQGRQLALAASLLMAVGAALAVRGVLQSGPERVRGGSGEIALVGPGTRVAAGAPLAFVWRAVPGVSRYVLEIQRADGSLAFTDTIADTVATVMPVRRLLPDTTYRWWVREVTDGSEPRSSAFRELRITGR